MVIFSAFLVIAVGTALSHTVANAAEGDFSLQVTPSPLVSTLKPGVPADLELKIYNSSTAAEDLKIEARSFRFDNATGAIKLDDTTVPDISPWLSFSTPTFSVGPGQWATQKIHVALPKETGFSYSFALVISRKNAPSTKGTGSLIKGSVAVFTLLNVDRPGAVRKAELISVEPTQKIYEFLPAELNIRLKNAGNTITQPYGNVYIHQGNDASVPIATMPVNQGRAYLLPGTERTLKTTWTDGFPEYQTTLNQDGTTQKQLHWNFDKLSHFRFGKYTARIVAAYNDGTRDIPITGQVSFWIIPWKAILIIIIIFGVGIYLIYRAGKRRTQKAVDKALAAQRLHGVDASDKTPHLD